ncbi:hypothetical protein ABVF61_00440 [Roseibium sp. HPY-6]|uniref:hypothetical protein n=1 Tax=Roseibium sp. HPY-6 TaxID=3229852 RepID=UPI00338D8282
MSFNPSEFSFEDRAVEFPYGVVLTMRPANSIDVGQAQTEASSAIHDMVMQREALTSYGVPKSLLEGSGEADEVDGDEDSVSDRFRNYLGLSSFISSVLLFEQVVTRWENVSGDDGAPLPINRTTIGQFLLYPDMKRAFDKVAYSVEFAVREEGNVSAVSQPGSGEAEDNTAAAAKT